MISAPNDSDSSLEMETNFVGIDTGVESINAVLFQVLTVEGSNSVTFNMDRLSQGTRDSEGKVSYAKSPVSDLSGISGRVQIVIPTVISVGGGFIYKEVGIDADGGIAASANDTVDTIGYLAVKGFLEMARKKKDSEGNPVKDSKGKSVSLIDREFGLNFAISEKGPLQFFVFASAPILLEPITGLSLTQVRGGIRFNSTVEDLQVRDPYTVSEDVNVDDDNTAIASGDAASPVQITLTVPDHNFQVGDEFRIPAAGDPDLVSIGENRFVVTTVDGDKITYLTGGGDTESNPANYSFGGTIEVKKISISDPADLRDPGFASTKNLSIIQWEEQLDQQVVNQANAGSWAFLNDDMVLELGATVSFQPRVPEFLLKADADVLLDTTGKLLVTGEMSLATVVKVPTKIFADLSDIATTGTANMLYLTDLPKAVPGLLEEPLIEIYAGVTFEALRNGVPFNRDITGLPAGVGTNVTGVTIVDLAGTDQGPWEVTLTLDTSSVDTQYAIGDSLVVVGSEPDCFDGTHVVTHVTETTVSFVIGSAIVAGGVDVNRDGTIDANDSGSLGAIPVIGGRLDMDEDGSVDTADDGEVFHVVVDADGTRQVVAYPVIDGYVDIDRDGNVTPDSDDNAVIGEDPRRWLLEFELSPEIVNGQVDIDGDQDADADDDGTLGAVPVVGGRLDMNRSGDIDADDDGEILKVAIDSAGNRLFASYHVIDGYIDIDGDETAGADEDDDLGVNPSGTDLGAYWLEPTFKAANVDDLGDGLRISVHGGVDLNIPSVTTLSLHGDATLDLVFGGTEDVRIDFTFGMSLSETHVGTIGTANGQFIVTLDHSGGPEAGGVSLPKVEIWGGAILATEFGFLESVGLYADASGLLVINSTSEDKDPITLDNTAGTATIVPTAQTFALRLDGEVDFRIDFDSSSNFDEDESVFRIGGIFVLEFSAAQGFNVAIFDDQGGSVVPASLTLGPPDQPLLEFGVLGFLAIRSGGFAADLVLTFDAALPGDLASIKGTAVLIVNTTGRDVIFEIPEDVTDPSASRGSNSRFPRRRQLIQAGFSLRQNPVRRIRICKP